MSRRDWLRVLGVGTVGAGFGLAPTGLLAERAPYDGPLPPSPRPGRPPERVARPFPLTAVELLDGPFREAQERDARYMLDLDPDRLLHNFRENAGLEPKAPVYGGWESQEPWVEIRCHGHTLGHWLTAGSLMYASTGDRRFRDRIDYIVAELAACQEAWGTGLVCAFPDGDETLRRAVNGEPFEGVPWYTMHKIFAGLRDAHLVAGSDRALPVLVRLTDWAWELTAPMSDAAFQRMLDREHGGMNEVLADIHVLTGDERCLTLARRFCHEALLQPLARGVDPLNGLHANTQIPKVVGFERLYEITGEERYGRAARFFWDTVVGERSFVRGGHGDWEHFFPVDTFPRHLHSAKTSETCCTYNMLRLTRQLFAADPSAAYADYYERALYNGILASQDPETGWSTYFQATRPGYVKLYHTPIDSFWCCTGSGLENHAKYGDSIYFRSDDTLWVNLFIPSTVRWEAKRITLRQETRFPEADRVRFSVAVDRPVGATLRIRYPGWCRDAELRVNGRRVDLGAGPGEYMALDRQWRDGDRVELRLPMHLRTEALPGAPDRVAFLYGPVVLAGRLGTEGLYPGADILRNERTSGMILEVPVEVPALAAGADAVTRHVRPVSGRPLTFETVGIGRPQDVELIPYYRLHHERFNLYWELL
ncbi:MAG: glycoside hydrolase family 127 protein [Longimicrobiales bacterium]|nr:glycoside hydrolase family 127 protein [Longimicrobiales bacterium]